jgi:thiamine biosynthesis protein ThiS
VPRRRGPITFWQGPCSRPPPPGATPLGLDGLGAIVAVGLPVIAIGGVTIERIPALRAAGAWGRRRSAPCGTRATPRTRLERWRTHCSDDADDEWRRSRSRSTDARQVPRDATLLGALAALGLDPRLVVVEHNRRIVRRPALGDVRVVPGDAIELVHFVGGG